jgi:protein transport protein SEC61 subunit alpha
VGINDKVIWTFIGLFIYLICCQIPLYGVYITDGADPLYMLRMMLASNRGSLMELGIQPMITSGMVLQLLAGAKIIQVDNKVDEDRQLFQTAQKIFGLLFTFGEATAYVLSGVYGTVGQLGYVNAGLIIAQLTFAGFVVLLLDELLQKGYGLTSGISVFIAANIAETIVWKAFSPITLTHGNDTEFEGAIIAFFHFMITKSNKLEALQKGLYRQTAPNLFNLIATVAVILVVVYFQGFKVELNITSSRQRGYDFPYPIRLFYTSNMPIILQSALISNLFFFSQLMYTNFKGNFLVGWLGTWQDVNMNGQSVPTFGLVYLLTPPQGLLDFIFSPLKTLFYISFVMITCAIFSKTWIEVSGSGSWDVAKQLMDEGMTIKGYKKDPSGRNIKKYLDHYIPIAASFGGLCIGALSVVADLLGAIGSGTGILLAVTIIYGMFEQYAKARGQGRGGRVLGIF